MKFLHPDRDAQLELSLEDVFLVPGLFEGGSRLDADLRPTDLPGSSQPLVSANMNAVTGKRMAETMARLGGLGVLPQDMDAATVARIVRHIKAADPRFDTPLVVQPDATLRDVAGLMRKRAHGMVLVTDETQTLLGVVTPADLRGRDQYTSVSRVMSDEVVTLTPSVSDHDAFLALEAHRVKAAPVVRDGRVMGILTRDDAVRHDLLAPSVDARGALQVGAAVGIGADAERRAATLRELGVDVLVVDTAHGHQRRMLDTLAAIRAAAPGASLVAGNVCTAAGTAALLDAGADVVKVNVGPGAMCTTRMQTGVGRPSFTSVLHCAREARARGRHVWADGGVRHPRDVALYLAAGASRVMVGTMLAGTWESPGDLQHDADGAVYKENYGMASARAVQERAAELDAFARARKAFFREGISSSRIYLREGRESVGSVLTEVLTGLQSALTYVGAIDLEQFHARAVVGVQTRGGFEEGTPHGRVRT